MGTTYTSGNAIGVTGKQLMREGDKSYTCKSWNPYISSACCVSNVSQPYEGVMFTQGRFDPGSESCQTFNPEEFVKCINEEATQYRMKKSASFGTCYLTTDAPFYQNPYAAKSFGGGDYPPPPQAMYTDSAPASRSPTLLGVLAVVGTVALAAMGAV